MVPTFVHHTHWSVESVVVRGTSDPSLSSVCGRGRRVVETWTTHMSVQDIEDHGHRSRWSESWCSETPTSHYKVYNIIDGTVFKHVSSRKKTTLLDVTWSFLFPSPDPPNKKLSATYPKRLPIKTPHANVLVPGQISWAAKVSVILRLISVFHTTVSFHPFSSPHTVTIPFPWPFSSTICQMYLSGTCWVFNLALHWIFHSS